MATTNIYILRLEGGRYYVGKSDDPARRFQQHRAGYGSAWTKKYKPLALEKVIPGASVFDEDKYTKQYMSTHGIGMVRGGSYANVVLDELQEEALKRELWGATDKCTRCGRSGHFIKDCYARTDIRGGCLDDESEEEEIVVCYRCGREGHYSPECYARTHVKGYYLS